MAASKLQALWNHPAGPKTKTPGKLSYPQQIVIACTGLIVSRYSTVIIPKNWNLFSVNIVMAGTVIYKLVRKLQHDYGSDTQAAVAKDL